MNGVVLDWLTETLSAHNRITTRVDIEDGRQ
jgi:hypothetical protein